MKAIFTLTLVVIAFGIGYFAKSWLPQDSSQAAFLTTRQGFDSKERFLHTELRPRGGTDPERWLANIDVLSAKHVPWEAAFREASQDRPLQQLVVLHWSRRNPRACWDYLLTLRDEIDFEDLARIPLLHVDPSEAIMWPNEACDPRGGLRWVVFHNALCEDMEHAFSLAPAIASFWGPEQLDYSSWADRNPRRALELISSWPMPITRRLLPPAARAMAREDLDAAIAWARQQPLGNKRLALRSIANHLADQHDDITLKELVLHTPNVNDREALLVSLLNRWRQSDPDRANAWIDNYLEGSRTWQRRQRHLSQRK